MNQIDICLKKAKAARFAAERARDPIARDEQIIRAERLLDEAWSLNEADDSLPPFPSGLWKH
jgi:hypothetical protein